MKTISLKDLLEAGCHFGHQVSRWNPRAKSYIFSSRDGVHIIDLAKTKSGLEEAAAFVKTTAANGGVIIFVGTKRQAASIVEEVGRASNALFLNERFPGGLLTNWSEMKKNLDKMNRMTEEKKTNAWEKFTKKEQLLLTRELVKLEKLYAGIASLKGLPSALFLIDIKKEDGAVREALRMGVPTVAICDSNVSPDKIDYPIPANDDAVGSIKFITEYLGEAYKEGRMEFEKKGNAETQKEQRRGKVNFSASQKVPRLSVAKKRKKSRNAEA